MRALVRVENRALATSGNYRNFRTINGKRYSHLIDPASGASAENELVSVSVLAKDCMTADAYATAFMVMGKEKTLKFLENHKELDVLLIYMDEEGEIRNAVTERMQEILSLRR